MSEPLVLPTKKVKSDRVNAKRLLIYSKPKTGKTTAAAGLENNLILDLEEGSGYVDALKVPIKSLTDIKKVGEAIAEQNYPYKYCTIDTVTALESLVMPLAVQKYKSTPMGKNFKGNDVSTLANGAGYLYIRQAFFEILNYIDKFAPHIILNGHIKDKQIDDKGNTVAAANIDLTGKIKSLICANADAIGYMYRKGDQVILSFKSDDEVTCGARPEHLRNKEIVISEFTKEGEIITHWDEIYI